MNIFAAIIAKHEADQEIRNCEWDRIFLPMYLNRLPPVIDKYDLMVVNGQLDFIIDSVCRSKFSKAYVTQLKLKINHQYEIMQRLQQYFKGWLYEKPIRSDPDNDINIVPGSFYH